MSEFSLAELVPLWRTLREQETTVLVTPAGDYVGALELQGLDIQFIGDSEADGLGEALRSLISSQQENCNLLFLHRIHAEAEEDIREYELACSGAQPAALKEYVASRARWLRTRSLRRSRIYLFFTTAAVPRTAVARGGLGRRLMFREPLDQRAHEERLRATSLLRNSLTSRFASEGISARELGLEDVWRIHHELLNPSRARARLAPPRVAVRESLWSPLKVWLEGKHLLEHSEAEQLVLESVEETSGRYFKQGDVFRRVATLKVLPEHDTSYFEAYKTELLSLRLKGKDERPFPYTLAVSIDIRPQGAATWWLNKKHQVVSFLRDLQPSRSQEVENVQEDVLDEGKKDSVRGLFEELRDTASKIVTLSASVLFEASSLDELDRMTETGRDAFNRAGNAELLVEEGVAQVPAFLAMMPGAGPYQLRKKACTSRNAADFMPVFAAWRGCARPASLLETVGGTPFALDIFDRTHVPAPHGLVLAPTGVGKSMTLGAMIIDQLAAGVDAVLVDNGSSWKGLTELFGGVHIPIDARTSIAPFEEWSSMLVAGGQLDPEAVQGVVSFLEVCVEEKDSPGFDKPTLDLVARGVRRCYESRFVRRPGARPLMSDFREAIVEAAGSEPRDRQVAADLHRRLRVFCGDGLYAEFLDRPSSLRFDSRLLTFDLAGVSKSDVTRTVAVACIVQAISARAAQRRRRTLVAIDEGHRFLGSGDAGERFLEYAWRTMRKHDVAMWIISQALDDCLKTAAGKSIVDNSPVKILLRHAKGTHAPVADYFGFSSRALKAFEGLAWERGHYSDLMLMMGERLASLRVAPHPLAYWLLTTDRPDVAVRDRAIEKNPSLDRLSILENLAARYPHGVPLPNRRTA